MERKHPKTYLTAAMALCLACLFSIAACAYAEENRLKNGSFSDGRTNWGTYMESGGASNFTASQGKGRLAIENTGSLDYAVQLYYDGFSLETGGVYRFSYTVTSTISRQITARLQLNGGDYHAYCEQAALLKAKEPQRVELVFTMAHDSDPAPRLCFNCGTPTGGVPLSKHELVFENVEVVLVDGSHMKEAKDAVCVSDVNLNQIGYRPGDIKTAVFRGKALGSTFQVIGEDGKAVYTGKLPAAKLDAASGEETAVGTFTQVTVPGRYTLRCRDSESYPFVIGEGAYEACFQDAARVFFLQRCGCGLSEELAGDFAHPACHTGEALLYGSQEKIDVSGGWHDAGDYGRYIVPAAKTVADLLLSYEMNPSAYTDGWNIPESGNTIPDVLDEVRYELNWMLRMQAETGGVYHKVTCLTFPGEVMPQLEIAQLYVSPVSLTATGDFAAVMALSARIYAPLDKDFAATCLKAARRAWDYLAKEENKGGFHNPKEIVTGEYPDTEDRDERYWAACELYRATGEAPYLQAAEELLLSNAPEGLGWDAVGDYGNMAYLAIEEADPALAEKVKNSMTKRADDLLALAEQDGYEITLGMDYPWGSNMTAANHAMHFLFAKQLAPEKAEVYQNAALNNLHYLMGKNPMGICYITGYGTVSTQSPHHRPSQAAGKAVPGMLAGGPNSGLQDPYAATVLAGQPPAKCYADNAQSYSTNEIAIYWNSPLLYVMAAFLP